MSLPLISIHAPREGCDFFATLLEGHNAISIHAPREGCDTINQLRMAFQIQFQSTHPARGATINQLRMAFQIQFQSTHPARGATATSTAANFTLCNFNPRTPRGVRLLDSRDAALNAIISIHAPREGCDPCSE